MKPTILGTGLTGLVGSKLVQDFADKYSFQNLDLNQSPAVDITQLSQVQQAISQSSADFVVHFAAYTDVSGAWQQRGDKDGIAYRVNVLGTQNVAQATHEAGKHLIHISTAYIFDGENSEMYTETNQAHPIEWYGETKALAEEKVMSAGNNWTILRIDQPFRSDIFPRKDVAHRVIEGIKLGTLPPQFTNHFIGPTFIDDFAKVIEWVIRTKHTGIFHASSGEKWSDFQLSQTLNQILQLNKVIQEGDLEKYLLKSTRPYQRNTSLNCEKLKSMIDFKLLSVEEALQKIIL